MINYIQQHPSINVIREHKPRMAILLGHYVSHLSDRPSLLRVGLCGSRIGRSAPRPTWRPKSAHLHHNRWRCKKRKEQRILIEISIELECEGIWEEKRSTHHLSLALLHRRRGRKGAAKETRIPNRGNRILVKPDMIISSSPVAIQPLDHNHLDGRWWRSPSIGYHFCIFL